MSQKTVPYIIIPSFLILLGFGTLSAFWRQSNKPNQPQLSEKINLAMRQTAHKLLKQAGDSTSTIAPIKQTSENCYLAKLEHHFNYDSLASILKNSFETYDIKDPYDVAVWDCGNNELILGYSSHDVLQGNGIPCGGRNQTVDCFNFTVTFTEKPLVSSTSFVPFLVGGLFVSTLMGLIYFFYFYQKKKEIIEPIKNTEPIDETHLIRIGNTVFHANNQTLDIKNNIQKLTFRETKLLQLFCNHKNELLDRDFILKHVWEDEGVLVGRSVDVFVSRLRKLLKEDDSLKIVNVHSRGYRFEEKICTSGL
jgi:DNA-binding winged helix-turn-helix (wHTH) protein